MLKKQTMTLITPLNPVPRFLWFDGKLCNYEEFRIFWEKEVAPRVVRQRDSHPAGDPERDKER